MSSESPPAKSPRPRAPKPAARHEADSRPWSLRVVDWGLIAAFLALTFLLGIFPLKDTDFWWHLRTGEIIRATGRVPRTDWYTFTAPDHPWIDLHWFYQVALSWGYDRGGVVALNLAKCVVTCAAVFLLVTARRRDWPVWAMLVTWLPALLLLGGRMYIRPETLSLLYLSIFLAVIFRWDRSPWLALGLPPVQAAWVNTQGLFVFGPIVLASGLIDAALRPGSFAPGRRRWWRVVGIASVLTGLACLINPYGLAGALYPFALARTMGDPIFTTTIAELTPIPLFLRRSAGHIGLPLFLHFATMALGALSFFVPMLWVAAVRLKPAPAPGRAAKPAGARARGIEEGKAPDQGRGIAKAAEATPPARPARGSRKRPAGASAPEPAWRSSPFRLLLFATFSLLSWRATRNSHQFAAVVGTLTAWNVGEWVAAIRERSPNVGRSPMLPRLAALGAIGAAFAAVASGAVYAMAGEGRTVGLGEEPLWYPHEAIRFAGQLGMPTRFLSFHDGYAALYEHEHGPERKVFVDARLEVIGPVLYERYIELRRRIAEDAPGWARALDEIGRPVVLVGHADNAVVGTTLLNSPGWRCVWFDPIAAIFVHEAYTGVVQAHTVDFAARHFRPDPATDPRGHAAVLALAKAVRNYVSATPPGRAGRTRPMALLGLDYGRRLLRADPLGGDGWKILGQVEFLREPPVGVPIARFRMPFDPVFDLSPARSTYAMRRALEVEPDDFSTLILLSTAFESRGMAEAALPWLDRLVSLRPINEHQVATQVEAEAKRAVFRAGLGPVPPRSWENLSELDRIVSGLLNAGRARSAAEVLERAYPNEPRPWDVTDRLATLSLHLGEPARARSFWGAAVSPPRPAVRAARIALTHLVEGSFDVARDAYRDALALDPALFEAHYGLAVLEQDAGRAAEALASARQAAANAPNDVARDAATAIAAFVSPYATPPPT
ncbi:MAG TPA: tetratricopeptide repeat protein [Isosphaeraceae bacterium]|nr:tetratricopeptide repeat protein [Isosphaeraceae bacterium]